MENQLARVLILALPLALRSLGLVTYHSDHPLLIVQRGNQLTSSHEFLWLRNSTGYHQSIDAPFLEHQVPGVRGKSANNCCLLDRLLMESKALRKLLGTRDLENGSYGDWATEMLSLQVGVAPLQVCL